MIRLVALAAISLALLGCDYGLNDLRTSPAQQVEDYAACKAGGMRPYRTVYGEIKCAPPEESNP